MDTQTHDLTLHQIDDDLYRLMVTEAQSRGWSINTTVKTKLKESYGLGSRKKKYRDLSWMKGLWTKKDVDEFDRALAETEKIYPGEW